MFAAVCCLLFDVCGLACVVVVCGLLFVVCCLLLLLLFVVWRLVLVVC